MGDKLSRADRIQINLAQISKNETDRFRVIRANNERDFTCELCGQKHVSKVYTVLNVDTGLTIRIGCECVKHFRIEKSDLDKAEGFLKRVERSIRDSKIELIMSKGYELFNLLPEDEKKKIPRRKVSDKAEELGNEYFQSMPLAERSEFYYSAYMMHEAIRLYGGGASGYDELTYTYQKGMYIYSKEEIYAAVDKIGSRNVFEKKIADIDVRELNKKRTACSIKFDEFAYDSKKERKYVDDNILSKIKEDAKELGMEEEIALRLEKLDLDIADIKARDAKYPWLFAYTGNNPSITNMRNWLIDGDFSDYQVKRAQEQIEEEKSGIKPVDIGTMINSLVSANPNNNFYKSIQIQYQYRKSLSEKQESCIRIDYKKYIKESAE